MLNIEGVNHVGIRVSDKTTSIDFYELLGFALIRDPDRNVIELDAYDDDEPDSDSGYSDHP